MNKKGFTLVEMIVAVVIITILASLMIPGTIKYIKEYQNEKYIVDAQKIYTEAQMFVVKKRVQYNVKNPKESITYDSCTQLYERTAPFRDAIIDLYHCEDNISLYEIKEISLEVNDQFQLNEFKVDYINGSTVKTVTFDKDGNASVYEY